MPPNPPTSATVLMVDDEEDILISMKDYFRQVLPHVRLLTARSGAEGLSLLKQEHVALIISDYKMPGMNGMDFLRQAERVAPGVTRIMITAYPDPDLAAQAAKDVGVSMLVTKPFDIDFFTTMVGAILQKAATNVATH